MLTKTQYCKAIIKDFCLKQGIDQRKITNWNNYIRYSSKLAVALEYLNLLNEEGLKYSSSRAGIVELYITENGESSFLTVRELLSLLPD